MLDDDRVLVDIAGTIRGGDFRNPSRSFQFASASIRLLRRAAYNHLPVERVSRPAQTRIGRDWSPNLLFFYLPLDLQKEYCHDRNERPSQS
jgi:hypothetical protein